MPAGSESIQGPRLAFVVKALPGTVTRPRYKAPPTKQQVEKDPSLAKDLSNQVEMVIEPAGYMVYLPTGFCYRMSAEELVRRKFDEQPNIISFEQANNTESPAGRFKLARDERQKQKAWDEMEQQVIKACQGRFGNVMALIEGYDPNGKIVEVELA